MASLWKKVSKPDEHDFSNNNIQNKQTIPLHTLMHY